MSATDAVIHVPKGEGEPINVLGEQLTLLVSAEDTRPALALMEVVSPPGSGPPGLHTHPPVEAFYVLEGTYEFLRMGASGVETVQVRPGSVIYVPGNAPHNYKNVGSTTGRMLAIFTDRGPEQFFKELSAATNDETGRPILPPDMSKVGAVMQKHGFAFVGSPPGPG